MKVYSVRKPIKRGKDSYQIGVCVGYKEGDKKRPIWKTKTVHVSNMNKACIEADKWVKEIEGEPDGDLSNISFGKWLDIYIEDCWSRDMAVKTIEGYGEVIEGRIKPKLGNVLLRDVNASVLTSFYKELKSSGRKNGGPLAFGTVRKTSAVISGALGSAVSQGLIERNPNRDAEKFSGRRKGSSKETPAFSWDEMTMLSERARLFPNRGLATAITIACYTGCRRAEICGLLWGDIDFEAMAIDINKDLVEVSKKYSPTGETLLESRTKTDGSERIIPMLPELSDFLREEKARQQSYFAYWGKEFSDGTPVLQNKSGGRMRPNTITTEFKEFAIDAGVNPEGSFRSTRSGVSSFLSSKNVPIEIIADLLGDTKETVFRHYIKNANDPYFVRMRSLMIEHMSK